MRPSLTGDARVSRREPVRRRAGRRWPALVGYAGLSLVGVAVALCIAAVAVLLLAPPLDAVRDRLIRQVQERTGRGSSATEIGPATVSVRPVRSCTCRMRRSRTASSGGVQGDTRASPVSDGRIMDLSPESTWQGVWS